MWETAIQQGGSDVLKLKQQVQSCAPHSLGYCTLLFPRFSKLSFSSATPDLFFLYLSPSCDSTQTLLISSPRPLPHPSSEAAGKPQEEWRLFISQESSSWGGGGASGRKLLRVGGASFLQGDALRWPPLPTRKVSHKSLALL